MVRKLGFISLIFSSSSSVTSSSIAAGAPSSSSSSSSSSMSWQWPSSCKQQPRTLSFRQEQEEEQKAAYKTMNSAYLPSDSCFSASFASVDDDSLSTASDEAGDAVIHALRTGRLFFEPCTSSPDTSSILSKAAKLKVEAMNDDDTTCSGAAIIGEDDDDDKTALAAAAFEGATAMTMESSNPYGDFRASMEEMVLSRSRGHGGTICKDDWRWMEEMLGWYLRANGKSTHGLIVGAFVDLLVALNTAPPPSSPTTASSSSSGTDEIKEEEVAYTCN